MIIGFESKRAFSNYTGLGNYSRSTVEQLSTFFPENQYILYTTPFSYNKIHDFANKNNIKVTQPSGIAALVPSVWRSAGIAAQAKKDNVKIFHGLSGEMPIGLKKRGIRSVVTIHDLIFLRFPEFYKPFDRRIYKKKIAMAAKDADLVIAISEQTKQDCINFLGVEESKIRVVYQGCSSAFEQIYKEQELLHIRHEYKLPEKYLLYVGTIEERKNLNTAIEALPKIPNDYKLVVIGRPTPYIDKVNAKIAELGIEERVIMLHGIPSNDLPAIYQMAFAFVYPSIFEGFGIPILEALNSRIPVITTTASCLPEAGGPDSLYIEPFNHTQLAEQVNRLISQNDFRSEVIRKGILHAANFKPKAISKNLWNVYKELL